MLIGLLAALGYFIMAVAGPPYYRNPALLGFLLNILTLPGLIVQEFYPASWGLKYHPAAIVAANAVVYAAGAGMGCLLRRLAASRNSGPDV